MDGQGSDNVSTIDNRKIADVVAADKAPGTPTSFADRARFRLVGSQATIDIGLLLLALAALAALKSDWLFNTTTYVVDAWMYLGYFLHYDLPTMLADNKKIARLPWILSGYLAHSLFPPVVAAYVLHIGYFAAGVVGLYLVLSRLVNRSVALFVGAFYVAHFIIHGTGGWDYHNTAAGPFYLFSYLALVNAVDRIERPIGGFLIFGVLFALTVHTNVLFLDLLPALAIQGVFQLARRAQGSQLRIRRIVVAGVSAIAGAVLCTVVLGAINVLAGREFLFFKTLLKVSTFLIENPQRELAWWESWSSLWWATNAAIMFPVIAVAASLLSFAVDGAKLLAHGRAGLKWTTRQTLCLEFLATMAITGLWQTLGHPILQPGYMAYPVYYPMLFAIAALLAGFLPERALDHSVLLKIVIVAIPAIFIATDTVLPARWLPFQPPFPPNLNFWSILVAGLTIALALSYGWRRSGAIVAAAASWLAVSATFGLANSQLAQRDLDMTDKYRGPYDTFDSCMLRRGVYIDIVKLNEFIFASFRDKLLAGKDPYSIQVWFDPKEAIGSAACGVNARQIAVPVLATGFGYIMPWYDMRPVGDIPAEYLAKLDPSVTPVIAITNNPANAEQLLARLRQFRPEWQITAKTEAVADGISVAAYILRTPD